MEANDSSYIGYIKYDGPSLENGYLDIRKSAEILLGIDEVLRYFLYQIDPKIQDLEFEIPVRIRKGSWETLIPSNIQDWLIAAGGIGLTKYLATAVTELAKNDVGDNGIKDVFKSVFKSIKWVLKIAKHLDTLKVKHFNDASFREENGDTLVGVKNDKDETLHVPYKYLLLYTKCPEKLFSKLAKFVDENKDLEIGINQSEPLDKDDTERGIKITKKDKYIFTKQEEDDGILFPELEHGKYVELEGYVTRGNENSNSIGFEYLRHIITCYPSVGNIKEYKELLFTNCRIKGYVDREDEHGNIIERRPKIKFIHLEEIPSSGKDLDLFNMG